jgi:hypothetical protein
MANTDNPHGFKIYGECLRVGYYAVPTAPAVNISIGDMLIEDQGNIVSGKLGLGVAVYDAAVVPDDPGAATGLVLGAVVACFDAKMDPIQYIPKLSAGDGTVAGYVAIADDVNQQYEAQIEGTLTVANFELNYDIVSADAYATPNTRTGLSTQEIAVDTEAVTRTLPIRLVSQYHPDDSYASAGCRVICQVNPECHRYGAGATIA